jgi:antitoxin CptB
LLETDETRRKRLLHRSRYRGQVEADLLFGSFAAAHVPTMDEGQLGRLEALLDESDADILAWVAGGRPAPARHDHDVLAMLRGFKIQG